MFVAPSFKKREGNGTVVIIYNGGFVLSAFNDALLTSHALVFKSGAKIYKNE
jgi:hypothetical protein